MPADGTTFFNQGHARLGAAVQRHRSRQHVIHAGSLKAGSTVAVFPVLQLSRPRFTPLPGLATLRCPDPLNAGAHGFGTRFSNSARASSREGRVRLSRSSALPGQMRRHIQPHNSPNQHARLRTVLRRDVNNSTRRSSSRCDRTTPARRSTRRCLLIISNSRFSGIERQPYRLPRPTGRCPYFPGRFNVARNSGGTKARSSMTGIQVCGPAAASCERIQGPFRRTRARLDYFQSQVPV